VDVANKELNVMLAHNSTKNQIFINSSIFSTERHPFDHVIRFFKKWMVNNWRVACKKQIYQYFWFLLP